MSSVERQDLQNPSTWRLPEGGESELNERCLAALRANGLPATAVTVADTHLKGGYICDTMRLCIHYEGAVPENAPQTAILKISSPGAADHEVATRLHLYEREWHFYEKLSARVAEKLRVPKWLGSVTENGATVGVLLEDLCVPGAILNPSLDESALLLTISAMARHHAAFWNVPELSTLGLEAHNSRWYQPGWEKDVSEYWPVFEAKWRTLLPAEAFVAGEAIIGGFTWIQNELSSEPHCFNHGDVKSANMFLMPDGEPAFIDWQYTAVGKGCQDILFLVVEGYTIEECRRLEPIAKKHYHAELLKNGVKDYAFSDLERDWKLACMHFPFYVAMWFGTTPDDQLVDPDFPRRFVPRCFDAILRNGAHKLLLK